MQRYSACRTAQRGRPLRWKRKPRQELHTPRRVDDPHRCHSQNGCSDTDVASVHTSDTPVSEDTNQISPREEIAKGSSSTTTSDAAMKSSTVSSATTLETTRSSPLEPASFVIQEVVSLSEEELPLKGYRLAMALSTLYSSWVDSTTEGTVRSKFHCIRPPAISVRDYMERLQKYFLCSDACFIVSLVYVERLMRECSSIAVTSLTFHRLFATSLMISAKFHDDEYYSNAYYAKVAGLKLAELNALELFFLTSIGWKTIVTGQVYEEAHGRVVQAAAGRSVS